ncbi:MAG: isoaspartyl peptidase/L-asparaginase [Sulfitobacter dubius]
MTYSLAIHGGAGTLLKQNMTPKKEAAYHGGLARAVEAGEAVLRDGGSALDAVVASVCALEDEPLFNAGRGAVYTSEGKQEMDAAVMDGRDRRAGSVAGVLGPKNPIRLAHAVMERTEHVTLIGPNALEIARQAELPFGDYDYFFTQSRGMRCKKRWSCARGVKCRTIRRGGMAPSGRWRVMKLAISRRQPRPGG